MQKQTQKETGKKKRWRPKLPDTSPTPSKDPVFRPRPHASAYFSPPSCAKPTLHPDSRPIRQPHFSTRQRPRPEADRVTHAETHSPSFVTLPVSSCFASAPPSVSNSARPEDEPLNPIRHEIPIPSQSRFALRQRNHSPLVDHAVQAMTSQFPRSMTASAPAEK